MHSIKNTWIRTAILPPLLLLAAIWGTTAGAEEGPVPGVGEVSLLLGKAWLETAEGRQPVKIGTAIHARDQIVTEANGHVHVRFIDEALVSVRPNSRLEITDYSYNRRNPERSTVQFRLHEGVTRSISGDAARSARDRFRLDTPIAAIGVRGTDFVVSASAHNVRAQVNEGVIVMAPYSDVCLSGTLGPCEVGSVELAGSSMQILELTQGDIQPVLRVSPEPEMQEMLDEESEGRQARGTAEREVVDTETVSEVYQETAVLRQMDESAVSTPEQPEGTNPLLERQMAWGHWSQDLEQTGIVLAYGDAREGRQIAISNNRYGLYSRPSETGAIDSATGRVPFQLDAASAVHEGPAGVEVMTVESGSLEIDFSRNRYRTSLDLDSTATGAIIFSDNGRLFSGGFFHNRGTEKNLAGAVSANGSEAGYFFDEILSTGRIEGVTLWGRPE